MSLKQQISIVAVSVGIAAILAFGMIKYLQAPNPSVKVLGDTDDAPIIMAGGSLYIGTGPDALLARDSTKTNLVFPTGMKVFQIDVMDENDAVNSLYDADLASMKGQIDLTYCKLNDQSHKCEGNKSDVVTVSFDNTSTSANIIAISNSLTTKIGSAPRILPMLFTHMRRDWKLFHIAAVAGTKTAAADCSTDSECSVVVHTCLKGPGNGCTAK